MAVACHARHALESTDATLADAGLMRTCVSSSSASAFLFLAVCMATCTLICALDGPERTGLSIAAMV